MTNLSGISKQVQCQYLLLQYVFEVKERYGFSDYSVYRDGVMHKKTFLKLKQIVRCQAASSHTDQTAAAKGGASVIWNCTSLLCASAWPI